MLEAIPLEFHNAV